MPVKGHTHRHAEVIDRRNCNAQKVGNWFDAAQLIPTDSLALTDAHTSTVEAIPQHENKAGN